MSTSVTGIPAYALGHSEHELERLCRQGEAFEPFTRQLLGQAGIRSGMRVLDVGSGAGDSSFLLAELVGQGGEVMGIDREPIAVEWATARARSQGFGNVQFFEGDPAAMEFTQKFDALVGRLVLMYYPDPVDAVQKLTRHLRPGGLIVFQEFDIGNARSLPPAPTFESAISWMKQTLTATGARMQLGLELYPVFLAAGLPAPTLRMDAMIGGSSEFPYELLVGAIQSLVPVMEKLKIATAADVELSTLEERMRDEVFRNKGIVVSPGLIGAWSRKPGINTNGESDLAWT
jgi:SAM-dependent methyltransferase